MVLTRASSSSSVDSELSESDGGGTLDGVRRASWIGVLVNGCMYKEALYWSCFSLLVRGRHKSC